MIVHIMGYLDFWRHRQLEDNWPINSFAAITREQSIVAWQSNPHIESLMIVHSKILATSLIRR